MKGNKAYFPFPDWVHTGAKNKYEASGNRKDKVSCVGMRMTIISLPNLDGFPNNFIEPYFSILTYLMKN